MVMRALIISAIVLVAVIMGLSAVASVIPYGDASPGGTLTGESCAALKSITDPPAAIQHLIAEHCPCIPPECSKDG